MKIIRARKNVKENSITSNPTKKKTLYPYTLGRIVKPKDENGNITLDKDWHVEYWIWNIDLERLVRKRESEGINKFATISQRLQAAELKKKEIDSFLIAGAVAYLKDELHEAEKGIDINKATLIEAFDYACLCKFPDLERGTRKGFNALRKHLVRWMDVNEKYKNALFTSYTTQTIYKFLDFLSVYVVDEKKGKIISKKTYNNNIGYLSGIYNFYLDREVISYNPVSKVKRKKALSGGHIPYLDDEIELIKKYLDETGDHQLLLFIQFIYYGFFRPHEELRYLQVAHIKKDTIYIPPEIAKNDTGQYIRIPKPLEKLIVENNLRNYPKNYFIFTKDQKPGPVMVGENYFYKRHRKMLETIGLHGLDKDLYCYKHTGNIKLFKAGADIKTIQEQNRHSTIQQTDTYLKSLGLFRDGTELDIFPEF
ncbi:hypothetical protein MYP_628 [Sporocytophaga myxococcoides]|uniref:Tyr recombinase domain-containing protein n=1 Tax=Sporocytophaga myxococcoides TaxID=153721 RepID=A0A098L945_9BACT|nr:tyrosine-type recombinase/integrase [Sporocytophaga myxococcoides]GAL83401.1 hypothetical protein MYP_628 [Sporocytophaga myxococcoides]